METDDEALLDVVAPGRGGSAAPSGAEAAIYSDTLGVYVEQEWGSGLASVGGRVQLCPAMFLPGIDAIPKAVKHIYSRLAAAAQELDQGVPELVLTLSGTGSSLGFEKSDALIRGLSQLVTRCSLWAVTSGEQSDPLANALSVALRSTLHQQQDGGAGGGPDEETLLIVANSADIVYDRQQSPTIVLDDSMDGAEQIHQQQQQSFRSSINCFDSRYNTFYMVLNKHNPNEEELLLFRAIAAVKLGTPPPALLIGVLPVLAAPMMPQTAAPPPAGQHQRPSGSSSLSSAQTPSAWPSQPSQTTILLPNAVNAGGGAADMGGLDERKPLRATLFAGSSLPSLLELLTFLQCGVPVLVLEDASELCTVLRNAFSIFQSAGFKHDSFAGWLGTELRILASGGGCQCSAEEIAVASQRIFELLQICSSADRPLLAFIHSSELSQLADHLLDLLARSTPDINELVRCLGLAVKLGLPGVLRSQRLEAVLHDDQASRLLLLALIKAEDGRQNRSLEVLAALFDQNTPILLGSKVFVDWLASTPDQQFFQSVVIGKLLGQPGRPPLDRVSEGMARRLNSLLHRLSGGIAAQLFSSDLFLDTPQGPTTADGTSVPRIDQERALKALACWALLLNRPSAVRTLCAYSHEPLAFYLVLSQMARELGKASRDWCFYERPLTQLSLELREMAVALLDVAYQESPVRAYQTLCRPLHAFGQLTPVQIAFQTDARGFVAHPCAQIWVERLLNGDLELHRVSIGPFALPRWLSILITGLFLLPVGCWVRRRQRCFVARQPHWLRPQSPTVALLVDGRQVQKVRTSSAASSHTPRSGIGTSVIRQQQQQQTFMPAEVVTTASGFPLMNNGGGGGYEENDASSVYFPSTHFVQQQQQQMQRSPRSRSQTPESRGGKNRLRSGESGGKRRNRKRFDNRPGFLERLTENAPFFYGTPIVKFWISLFFHCLYLCILGWHVVQTGCALPALEFGLWLWTLGWFAEDVWVMNARLQQGSRLLRRWRWTLLDLFLTANWLLFFLFQRALSTVVFQGRHETLGSAYAIKTTWALLFLYQCFKTLFLFAPLSPTLGPMLVRIRLILAKNLFPCFLLALFIFASSALTVKAVLWPDLTPTAIGETFSFLAVSLFHQPQNDVLPTKPTLMLVNPQEKHQKEDRCQRMFLTAERGVCQAIGGYADPRCPTKGWFSKFAVLEYLLLLKLIGWPLLLALFVRSDQRLEEREAEELWRVQLFALATDFANRPALPPPLSPLWLLAKTLGRCCAALGSKFGGGGNKTLLIEELRAGFSHGGGGHLNHPDILARPIGPYKQQYATIYRNPSVPKSRPTVSYWKQLALGLWKLKNIDETQKTNNTCWEEKMRRLERSVHQLNDRLGQISLLRGDRKEKEDEENEGEKDWLRLVPSYAPSCYSQPITEFPVEQQHSVDDISSQSLVELAHKWRQRKLNELLLFSSSSPNRQARILLSGNGLPLNPGGRTGLAGRGNFPHFGPNKLHFIVILTARNNELSDSESSSTDTSGSSDGSNSAGKKKQKTGKKSKNVGKYLVLSLLSEDNEPRLPSFWHDALLPPRRLDSVLGTLLDALEVSDTQVQAITSRSRHLALGAVDGRVAHVLSEPIGSSQTAETDRREVEPRRVDTDNAWTQADVWAVNLSGLVSVEDGDEVQMNSSPLQTHQQQMASLSFPDQQHQRQNIGIVDGTYRWKSVGVQNGSKNQLETVFIRRAIEIFEL